MIGAMWGQDSQWTRVLYTGLAALVAGILLSPFLASVLPFGLNGQVASIVMQKPDDWNAGIALMKEGNPKALDRLAAAWRLLIGDQAKCQGGG